MLPVLQPEIVVILAHQKMDRSICLLERLSELLLLTHVMLVISSLEQQYGYVGLMDSGQAAYQPAGVSYVGWLFLLISCFFLSTSLSSSLSLFPLLLPSLFFPLTTFFSFLSPPSCYYYEISCFFINFSHRLWQSFTSD